MEEKANFSAEARRERREQERMRRKKQLRFLLLCAATVVVIAVIVGAGVSSCSRQEAPASAEPAALPTAIPKPAPEIPPASEQNDLLKIAVDAQGTEEKIAYLTFDDGPTREVTPAVLDVLKQYNVKATFFMLGQMIERNPDLAKRVYDEGHLLANHSYSHSYGELYASGDSFMGEIEKTTGLICDVTGEEAFKLMRFPGGSHNAGAYGAVKQQYKLLLQENGYYYADWNSLNGDAEGSSRSAEQLVARLKETSTAEDLVILMHDAATKKTTAEALPAIIEYLQGQGYVFKRMDEIKYYGGDLEKPVPDMIL